MSLKSKLVRLTYNCAPDSLGGISQEEFVDALENEFAVWNQVAALTVTFQNGKSAVTSVATADGELTSEEDVELEETMRRLGEEAFSACCRR